MRNRLDDFVLTSLVLIILCHTFAQLAFRGLWQVFVFMVLSIMIIVTYYKKGGKAAVFSMAEMQVVMFIVLATVYVLFRIYGG